MVKHIESWNVEPGAVVKSLLKPSAKKPSNSWEKSVLTSHHISISHPHLSACLHLNMLDPLCSRGIHFSLSASPCALSAACVICLSCTGARVRQQARVQRAPFRSRFFKAVHDGDPGASWAAAASPILRWYAFPVVALSAISKGFTGHGLPVRCHSGSTDDCIHMCQLGMHHTASFWADCLQAQLTPAQLLWGGVKEVVIRIIATHVGF